MFGFGGKPKSSLEEKTGEEPQQEKENLAFFACNGDFSNPQVKGIHGALESYKNCLANVQFLASAELSPFLKHLNHRARATQVSKPREYTVLIVLTSEDLTDFEEARDQIVESSELPVSIIIIGIGENKFTLYSKLDKQEKRLKSGSGVLAKRENVQFFPMRQVESWMSEVNSVRSIQKVLSDTLLRNLPLQMIEYFSQKNIDPVFPGITRKTKLLV